MTPVGDRRIGKRADQKRRWDRDNLLTCACGNPMHRQADRCLACRHADDMEHTREKRSYIASCWAAGMTMSEIAAGLGTTQGTIAVEIARMRQLDWDLPYRRNARR